MMNMNVGLIRKGGRIEISPRLSEEENRVKLEEINRTIRRMSSQPELHSLGIE